MFISGADSCEKLLISELCWEAQIHIECEIELRNL